MKHPVLARVFAVVLAVMAVILTGVGIAEISEAVTDKKENTRVYDLLVSRTAEYRELSETLKASDDPEELEDELNSLENAHKKNKASHQVNLATYTATRSGLSQADTKLLEQIKVMIPGLEINSYTLESFTGLAPLLVFLYPELQDAANNLQAAASTYTLDLRNAASQLRAFSDAAADTLYLNEAQLIALAEENGYEITGEERILQAINSVAGTGKNAAGKIETAAWSALTYAKKLVDLVDSYDGTVATLDSYIPQLVTLLDSKAGLSDTKTDLVNSKTRLDKEEAEIAELREQLDSLQTMQKRQASLAVLMKTNQNIKAAVDKGGDILTVADAECERMQKNTARTFRRSVVIAACMIIAGLSAFAGIPAAYEKVSSRLLLVAPVASFTALSAAAEILNEFTFHERQYAAIAAAALGLLQLAVILPREKLPEDEEE